MNDKELVHKMQTYVKEIRNELAVIEKARARIERQYETTLKMLDEDLAALRTKCPHLETTYHPDASGNNDSWNECNLCGKEL
ncbi:hypothetical protein LCGC14_2643290 [marine sediment metagenome]|uniref:Uncharacterized protein n=1 Tax=marine sediment metagenome TaxID=412755 RepID=A0A0F8ZWW3_9ZZZZ